MPPSELLTAEAILNTLLDRFEEPKQRSRDITQAIDYRRVEGPAAQDELHRVLGDAERSGGVALEKSRLGRFTGEYARVRLVDGTKLYAFLARTPANTVAQTTRRQIEETIPEICSDPFFREILREAESAWQANKSFLGAEAGQADRIITIMRLTHGIIHLAGPDIDRRTFSRRTVKDSKALEHLETRVAQLLRRRDPSLDGDEPYEVLEACGIVRRAHSVFAKGPIKIESNGIHLNGTGAHFIGLPWAMAQSAILDRPVDYIIAIENPTSFWRFCSEIEGSYLALLTDGFPARDVLLSMKHLVTNALSVRDVPTFHWGDIDAGGLRIAAHLEDAFEVSIRLHQMDPDLASRFGSTLKSRTGLERLCKRVGDIGRLANWLSTNQAKALEQEELDPQAPDCRPRD